MRRKKLLCMMLTFALVFTTVFASTGSVFAGEKAADKPMKAAVGHGFLELDKTAVRSKVNAVDASTTLKCTNVLTSQSSTVAYTSMGMPANTYWLTTVTPKYTGMMYLDTKVTGAVTDGDSISAYIVVPGSVTQTGNDLSWNYYIGYSWNVNEGSRLLTTDTEDPFPVKGGETYQILFISEETNKETLTVDARAKVYTTGSRTISGASTSKYTIVSGIDQDGEKGNATWFKVKAEKSGVMTVTLKEYGYSSSYGKVRLYNSDKKARSSTVTYSSSGTKVKFGVKKGRTYYLKVSNCYGTSNNAYKYGVRYTISSATDRSISSKSKAKRLYRKDDATKSLFVAANANSVDYYKFTVKTARKTKITVKNNGMSSGYITMRLYKSSGKLLKKIEVKPGYEGYIYTTSSLAKGTYYVKITKSTMASGSYTVRWTY